MRAPAGYYLPSLSRINKIIVIATVSLFLLQHLFQILGAFSLFQELGLSLGFFQGKIYQLLTYPFIHHSFVSLLFNLLMVWFMGSEFERLWGEKIYLKFILLLTISSGLFYLLLQSIFPISAMPLFGLTGLNLAFCLAQATIYPDRVFTFFFIFPLRAIHFCGILIALELYQAIFGGQLLLGLCHLWAMLMGFIVIKYQTHFILRWYFKGKSGKSEGSSLLRSLTKKKTPSHLKLIKDEDEKPPRYWH